jgi:hypothetical protein
MTRLTLAALVAAVGLGAPAWADAPLTKSRQRMEGYAAPSLERADWQQYCRLMLSQRATDAMRQRCVDNGISNEASDR